MSDFGAIAGVSRTMQTLLADRMEFAPYLAAAPTVTISTPRPDPPNASLAEEPRVNLFLYHVARSPFLENQETRGHGHPAAYGHPPLSLTLHYLVTAYGARPVTELEDVADDSTAHYVLGSAMRVLHDIPVVTDVLTCRRPPRVGEPVLDAALRDAAEQVKLLFEPISLEDLTKIWTALAQRFRLSAAYAVSVVQIESRRARTFPRLVGEPPAAGPRIQTVTLRHMRIDAVLVRRAGETAERTTPYARVGDTLILHGTGFAGTSTRVVIGGLEVEPAMLQDDRIEVVIPDDTLPDGTAIAEADRLQPGAQTIAVAAPLGVVHGALRSNHAVFMLVPHVAPPPAPPPPQVDTAVVPRVLHVFGTRLWSDGLSGETIIGREAVPAESYRLRTPTHIALPLPDTLPASGVAALVSGPITDPVVIPPGPDLEIAVAGSPPRTVAIGGTMSLAAAAAAIQTAMRNAPDGGAPMLGFRAAAVDGRLVLLAGELGHTITVTPNTTATALGLTGAGAQQIPGYLSGVLHPFPALTATTPQLRVAFGGTARTVTLASRPVDIRDAAIRLQAALRAAGGTAAFSGAHVVPFGDQLLVLPGAAVATTIDALPATDATSVVELALRVRYPIRVRVNGAETTDDESMELPA